MRSWELKGQVAGGITQHVLVILKVSKFPVMIRTDAFCFGNFLQISFTVDASNKVNL